MSKSFTFRRRVEFCETDMAGIVHFASYVCFMEQAEHAFWRHIGVSVVQDLGGGVHRSWPRVNVECSFQGSARFEDVLSIDVRLARLGTKSVQFAFQIDQADLPIATGKVVAVCCLFERGKGLESIEIPSELRAKLEPFVSAEASS